MFIFKKKYFLIIDEVNNINLNNIKRSTKFIIIYRNNNTNQNYSKLKYFRNKCKLKFVKFYVANNFKLANELAADGIYLSASNKTYRHLYYRKLGLSVIGSAHNIKEIYLKIKQKCDYILMSKLFIVDYDKKKEFLGTFKFNKFIFNMKKKLIPLGGIKIKNLNHLTNNLSEGLAIMTEIKKKPAILSRLF